MSAPERGASVPALVLFYLFVYGAGGITQPFLPQYFKTLGLTGTELGFLLAMNPLLLLFAPPLWGQLADRTGRMGATLLAVTVGATVSFGLLLVTHSYAAVFFAYLMYASFNAPISTLIDSTTLRHIAREGGSYPRIRMWGSIGYATVSLAFGRLVDVIDDRTLYATLAMLVIGTIFTTVGLAPVTMRAASGPRPSLQAALDLAKSADMRVFLAACALHWLACGPYHSALAIHVTALGLPTHVIGDAATVGVLSEIAVMLTWPRWGHLVSPRTLLFVAFAATGVRWVCFALTTNGTVLVALGLFHGLTFGVFFLSAVAFMTQRVPESLRASGQALFVSSAYGVGALCGFLLTGVGIDLLPSTNAVFGCSAVVELIAAMLVLRLPRMQPAVVTS